MKGILLAGGSGTRLHPMTLAASKQLLPVYDKPMVYYPLSTLMLAGIRDILVITTPADQAGFVRLLGDGSRLGLAISYAVQPSPDGIAQAFTIGRQFLSGSPCTLALGDNLIHGEGMGTMLSEAAARGAGATVFAYQVRDPERYGVVWFDGEGRATELVEKPREPSSNWAVIGLYVYDGQVSDIAAALRPGARGELEITDVNRAYLARNELHVERMGRGYAWLDAGTPASLLAAATFVHTLQERQGLMIGCPEEVAFRMGFIDAEALTREAAALGKTDLGAYLARIAREA
jgi:glucose-1-phosphate thymidylyltransferase